MRTLGEAHEDGGKMELDQTEANRRQNGAYQDGGRTERRQDGDKTEWR